MNQLGPGSEPPTTSSPLAPLPPAARGPAVPFGGFLRQEVGDGLFVVTDGAFQMMFLVGDGEVIVVDAPPTLAAHIPSAIAEVTTAPVRHVVYSHHHADHIGAASSYPADAARYAHRDTAALLARFADANRPAPTVTFDDSLTVDAGDQLLQLDYRGPNHSPGNIFIHAPRQRALMLVDVVFPGWVPFASLAYSTDVPGWIAAHDDVLAYPFDTFVGGHLARLGTRDDVVVQQEYLADLRATIENEFGNVDMQAVFAGIEDPNNSWAVFSAYSEAVANGVTDEVVPRWTGRLGGADVYTKSHAATLAEALRIDYGTVG